jgi:hypothetical protein
MRSFITSIFTKTEGYKIKKDERTGKVAHMGETRNANKYLAVKFERKL